MSFYLTGLRCESCSTDYNYESEMGHCPKCDNVLIAHYDLDSLRENTTRSEITKRAPSLWKYRELLPIRDEANIVSMGEGGTFTHKCERLAQEIGLKNLYLKDETRNPTGSFIDRGTSVEVSVAKDQGFMAVSCGSSGNLAASLVAYAARAGMRATIFIPQRVDIGKLYQILAFSPDVHLVRNQEEARKLAGQVQRDTHAVAPDNPFFLEGEKTTTYEICEYFNWNSPDYIMVPMGSGGHASMVWKALNELTAIGFLSETTSRLVGTQAKGCSPIVNAFQNESEEISSSKGRSTIAIDIAVKDPSCGQMALTALHESNGIAAAVSDTEILQAVNSLAKLEGVFAEPASATTIAALEKLVKQGIIDRSECVVCIITGMGLKYPEIAKTFVKGRTKLEQLLSQAEGRRITTRIGKTKVRILSLLFQNESYGYEIWKNLETKYGKKMKIPSVYQHLSELASAGLVVKTRSEQTLKKTVRRYYAISERGKWTLHQLKQLDQRSDSSGMN